MPSDHEPWLELTSDAGMARWRPGQGDVLRVTPDGLWPRGEAFIPAERYERAVVHHWRQLGDHGVPDWAGLSVLLDDGATVCIPAMARPLGRQREGRAIYWRTSDVPRWTTLASHAGESPIAWSALNDEAVGLLLDGVIHRVLRRAADSGRAARKLGNLSGISHGTGRVLGLGPAPHPHGLVWTPLRAIPRGAPLVPSIPARDSWEAGPGPVCFRSRGSARLLGKGHFLRFTAAGLDLVERGAVTTVPYELIDRIDDAYDVDGVRRLSVVELDGTLHDLPGLRHGSWAADPSLRGNELQWWWGDRPDGDAHGAVAWGSNDDALAITRLRFQLDAARGDAGAELRPAA